MQKQVQLNIDKELLEMIINQEPDAIKSLQETILNQIMKIERQKYLNASEYERTEDRV